ncbi:glycosyltransferase family protein [Halococcus agarilyticus]|uniref:glycosyl transferase family 2 n=1 Tax=Halococcus agarilyticus TaxID=1232219 RepID=UPI000677BF29|nr:glycosyl transferase family 2 [Halococcus agarilyticus]
MEYVQERIATLHDFGDAVPDAPTDRATVVVPMTDREYRTPAAERVLSTLADVDPERVLVALRTEPENVGAFDAWLGAFDPVETLWCGGRRVRALLAEHGLDGAQGKGRDVWLALGVAALDTEYVVIHDADATSYSAGDVPTLLAPLADEFGFVKGYYARIERNRLFGRLFRLFYTPLVCALAERHDAAILSYLDSFRYALAGEVALTADLARRLRVSREWGLEIDTLGAAFDAVGFAGTAQVDLGTHVHDHRDVGGSAGLAAMSRAVGAAVFRTIEKHGVEPAYETLPARYESAAGTLVDQYAADAAHNGLDYDRAAERDQVSRYAAAIEPPGADTRLPAWADTALDPERVREAARADLAAATGSGPTPDAKG